MTNRDRRRELEKIRKAHNGVLEAGHVVEAASEPSHPLHDAFEWDDTQAAHQYRVWQARQMIRVIVIFDDTEDEEPTRAYVSLNEDRTGGGGYRATVEVMSNAKLRNQLLAEAIQEMEVFQEKYQRLTGLAEIFAAMRSAKRKIVADAAMMA